MKQQSFTVQEFASGVIQAFKEKYPEDAGSIDLNDALSEREQMERILDYCVKKGYTLPELLDKFNS